MTVRGNASTWQQRLSPYVTAVLVLLPAMATIGCQAARDLPRRQYWALPDNVVTSMNAHHCASRDLTRLRRMGQSPRSHHYADGFRDAYRDIALGKRPSRPVTPPDRYWTAYYRSSRGEGAVREWFEGYEAGLLLGCAGGVNTFNQIAMDLCSPADRCSPHRKSGCPPQGQCAPAGGPVGSPHFAAAQTSGRYGQVAPDSLHNDIRQVAGSPEPQQADRAHYQSAAEHNPALQQAVWNEAQTTDEPQADDERRTFSFWPKRHGSKTK